MAVIQSDTTFKTEEFSFWRYVRNFLVNFSIKQKHNGEQVVVLTPSSIKNQLFYTKYMESMRASLAVIDEEQHSSIKTEAKKSFKQCLQISEQELRDKKIFIGICRLINWLKKNISAEIARQLLGSLIALGDQKDIAFAAEFFRRNGNKQIADILSSSISISGTDIQEEMAQTFTSRNVEVNSRIIAAITKAFNQQRMTWVDEQYSSSSIAYVGFIQDKQFMFGQYKTSQPPLAEFTQVAIVSPKKGPAEESIRRSSLSMLN